MKHVKIPVYKLVGIFPALCVCIYKITNVLIADLKD